MKPFALATAVLLTACNAEIEVADGGAPQGASSSQGGGTTAAHSSYTGGIGSSGTTNLSSATASSGSTASGASGTSGSGASGSSSTSGTSGSISSGASGGTTSFSATSGTTSGGAPDAGAPSVTLHWTFNGGETCGVAGVQTVEVDFGQLSQTFPCLDWASGLGQGALDGAAGTGPITVTGNAYTYDSNGNDVGETALYQLSKSLTLTPGEDMNVDLPALAAPKTSTLLLQLSFPWEGTGEAAVSSVTVQWTDPVKGPTTASLPMDPSGNAVLANLAAGAYALTVSATSAAAVQYFAGGRATVNGFTTSIVQLAMQPASALPSTGVGAFSVLPSFGSIGEECGAAELANLQVFLTDSTGQLIPNTLQTIPCDNGSLLFDGLTAPAVDALNIEGLDGSGDAVYSATQVAFSVFPGATSSYFLLVDD